jgi:hypothetical protein
VRNFEIESETKIRIGRPVKWNAVYNEIIRKYFEQKGNIHSCHMAWTVIDREGEVPHFILCIKADVPESKIGEGLVNYCKEQLGDRIPLTDIVYEKGDAISKAIRFVGRRIYPKRRFLIF